MNKADAEPERTALQLVSACRARLDKLNRVLQQRQWQRASDVAAEYALLLRGIDEVKDSQEVRDELVQLDIYHRRTMRLLSSHMTTVNEDIQSLESGQKLVRRSQQMAEVVFQ